MEKFNSWSDMLKHVSEGKDLYYHAPMDRFPVRIVTIKQFKNGKLRISAGQTFGSFTIDPGHLSRLRFKKN